MLILYSPIAQSVEQMAVNHRVGGSSPSGGVLILLAGLTFKVRQQNFFNVFLFRFSRFSSGG